MTILKEIEIFPTQVLIDELSTRFDHFVFIARKKGKLDEENVIIRDFKGDHDICVGLLNRMQLVINDSYLDTCENPDIEDV